MAAGGAVRVGLILGVGAVRVGRAAAGATAVELDALSSTGDSVALARARGSHGRGGRAVGAGGARGERRNIGAVRVIVRVVILGVEGLSSEAGVEGLEGGLGVVTSNDVGSLAGALGLGGADGRGRDGATLGNDAGVTAGGALGLGRGGLGSGNIEDVELAASGGLDGVLAAGVVGDLVAVEHVVEPVALTGLEDRGLEAEGTLPGALGARERKLALVAVPGTDEVDSLDGGGGAESKGELSSGHCEDIKSG